MHTKLKTIAEVHNLFKQRLNSVSPFPSHLTKSVVSGEIYPNGNTEAFIIMEHQAHFAAMRIVASPEKIEEERKRLEDSGHYISVVSTQRVK